MGDIPVYLGVLVILILSIGYLIFVAYLWKCLLNLITELFK